MYLGSEAATLTQLLHGMDTCDAGSLVDCGRHGRRVSFRWKCTLQDVHGRVAGPECLTVGARAPRWPW
eukprot:1374488-Alexandrium_andersonii.AAC.1